MPTQIRQTVPHGNLDSPHEQSDCYQAWKYCVSQKGLTDWIPAIVQAALERHATRRSRRTHRRAAQESSHQVGKLNIESTDNCHRLQVGKQDLTSHDHGACFPLVL